MSPAKRLSVSKVGKLYFPHLGGVETQMHACAGTLAKSGVDVEIVVGQSGRAARRRDVVGGINVERMTTLACVSSNPVTVGLGRRLANSATDLIHVHAPFPSGEIATLRSVSDRPVVITHHMDVWRQKLLLKGFAPFQKALYKRARYILASSPQLADHSPLLRANSDRVAIVPLGIDVAAWEANEELVQAGQTLREKIGKGRPIVLFVGRLVYYKDVDVLLRAVDGLAIVLVIVGTGPLEQDLRRQAAALSGTTVIFEGAATDNRLRALYQAADLFVLPSGHPAETFGVVLLEAALNRLPLVTSDVPTGVQHVNKHGETGLVARARDPGSFRSAIRRLVDDPIMRRTMGEAARERATSQFNIERVSHLLMEVYREAIR